MTDRRLRVLQVVTRLVTRGAPRHVVDLARTLDPGRYEVEIAAGRGEPYEGDLWGAAVETGLRCHRIESLQREISPISDISAYVALRRLIGSGSYDIVHTHISKSGLLGRLAARSAGVPVVVHTYHGIASELDGGGVRPRVLRALERFAAQSMSRSIAVSQLVAEGFEKRAIVRPGQTTVIHNGIDLLHFCAEAVSDRPQQLREDGPVVGTVGSLTTVKGTSVLLDAAAILARTRPDLIVCIVGDGPLAEQLKAQALELGIGNQVLFAGDVEDVRPWVCSFDVFVQSSHSEGMSMALLEAMALGCPVVATRVGGTLEVVGDAGILIEPGHSEAMAGEIDRILSDSDYQDRISRLCAERARAFSLSRMAAETSSLYEELYSAHTQQGDS